MRAALSAEHRDRPDPCRPPGRRRGRARTRCASCRSATGACASIACAARTSASPGVSRRTSRADSSRPNPAARTGRCRGSRTRRCAREPTARSSQGRSHVLRARRGLASGSECDRRARDSRGEVRARRRAGLHDADPPRVRCLRERHRRARRVERRRSADDPHRLRERRLALADRHGAPHRADGLGARQRAADAHAREPVRRARAASSARSSSPITPSSGSNASTRSTRWGIVSAIETSGFGIDAAQRAHLLRPARRSRSWS